MTIVDRKHLDGLYRSDLLNSTAVSLYLSLSLSLSLSVCVCVCVLLSVRVRLSVLFQCFVVFFGLHLMYAACDRQNISINQSPTTHLIRCRQPPRTYWRPLNLLPAAEQNSNNYLVFDRVVTVLYESTSLLVTRCTLSYAGRRPEAVACLRDAPRIQRALAVDDVLYHCLESQLPFRRLLPPLPDIDPDLDLLDCAIIGLRCVECTENKSM